MGSEFFIEFIFSFKENDEERLTELYDKISDYVYQNFNSVKDDDVDYTTYFRISGFVKSSYEYACVGLKSDLKAIIEDVLENLDNIGCCTVRIIDIEDDGEEESLL
jgi:hypothetical protein